MSQSAQRMRNGAARRPGRPLSRATRAALLGALLLAGSSHAGAEQDSGLAPVPEPDLSVLEPAVRERLATSRREFTEVMARPDLPVAQQAAAYGEIGRLYHAHHLYDPAEACYLNAERLTPADFHWPYLLGVLYQESARFAEAADAYTEALRLRPGLAPAKVRLAQVYLGLNRPERAEPLLQEAVRVARLRGAAAFELGKAAMARDDYRTALDWFRQALKAQPEASRIHYPMAMAYRALKQVDRARSHLRRRGDVEPELPDPVVDQMRALLGGARTHQYRAMKAVWNKQFDLAAQEFAKIIALEPDNTRARVSLARALYMTGDEAAAEGQLREALARNPEHAYANYFMGRLLEEQDLPEEALQHYRRAVQSDPYHAGAQFFLANELMREGRFAEAAEHYRRAVEILPEDLPARAMEVLALIAVGDRDAQAMERLTEALAMHPDDSRLRQAQVRLLAAGRDPGIRDGQRALSLAKTLFEEVNSIENAEQVAMAYAELGDFENAQRYQQAAIDAAYGLGAIAIAEALESDLEAYRHGQPSRTPWAEDAEVFYPAPQYGALALSEGGA